MSPVGTMASDSTVHGVHHHHQPPPRVQPEEEELYDDNSYAFSNGASHDMPASDVGGYYQSVGEEDEVTLHPHDSQSQRYAEYDETIADGYTSTPSRVAARRWTNSPQARPGLATMMDQHAVQSHPTDMVSPRGSTVVGDYPPSTPPRPSFQHSPQTRPTSALRSSLVMPSNAPGSPQRMTPHEAVIERIDYPRGSPARSSMPNIGSTPPRRVIEQHRVSAPNASPVVGSPQYGSPRQVLQQSPNPDVFTRSPGYKQYDEYYRRVDRRLSPVPPYQSPRNSGAFPADWDRRPGTGRRDSDTTLQGEYNEKSQYRGDSNGRRNYAEKSRYSPQPDQDYGLERDSKRPDDYRRQRGMSTDSISGDMRRRTTREVEDDSDYQVKGGVFSQLLRLTGRSSTLRRRVSSQRSAVPGQIPTMKSLGLRRADSGVSTTFGADELDTDDPRVTGQKKKARRSSFGDLPFMRTMSMDGGVAGPKKRRASIQFHVACMYLSFPWLAKDAF